MGKSQETFGKKEREKKRAKKRQEKLLKKEARKSDNNKGKSFEEMLVYVDEFGQLSDTPPDKTKKVEIDASSIVLGVPKKSDLEEVRVKKGTVDFFNDEKGFGFILEKDSHKKHFVHVLGCLQEIVKGDKVMFELEMGPRGMQAVNVKKM